MRRISMRQALRIQGAAGKSDIFVILCFILWRSPWRPSPALAPLFAVSRFCIFVCFAYGLWLVICAVFSMRCASFFGLSVFELQMHDRLLPRAFARSARVGLLRSV